MEFRILGPLEVLDDAGRRLAVARGSESALLAILLLHANEVVSSERLIDDLWGERPPATAAKIVQNHVSHLRRTLGDRRLVTRGPGYVLEVEPEALDLRRFEQLAKAGGQALGVGEAPTASQKLTEALALWRGPALADVAYEPFAQAEIARLEELRLAALEDRIEADLALGRQAELVGELETLVAEHPLRERLRGQLILALYRSGRQAEALQAYQETRRALDEELGLEPSEELKRLEKAILTHDPALAAPPRMIVSSAGEVAVSLPSRAARVLRRPRVLAALGVLAVVGAAVAAAVELTGGSAEKPLVVAANSVAVIDPDTNRVVAEVPVGARPIAVAVGEGAVWVANADDGTVSRIDPETRKVVKTIGTGTPASDLAVGAGAVWVANGSEGTVSRIDPRTNTIVETLDLSGPSELAPYGAYTVATGAGAVWLGSGARKVLRIDPKTNEVVATVGLAQTPAALAVGEGGVWVAHVGGRVLRIEPESNAVTGIVAAAPLALSLAVGQGAVWVGGLGGAVWRIDPATVSVLGTTPELGTPLGVAVGGDAVWVAGGDSGTLFRIDPSSGRVIREILVGNAPLDVAVGEGAVWLAVGSKETTAT